MASKEKIPNMKASEVLKNNFMPYAMSVIMSRAIPEIDGLKPSHRKLLYTMYEMGLLTGGRTKSANVAARTMLLNPHGDAAIYETAVRFTQNNETLLTPFVDGKGNFGKHYSRDASAAASRYTEMKLMPVAGEFFKSIKKDTVDFVDNYDSTRKEPTLLPVTFPSILANPTEGIAVGMASSIPSFNLVELCDATIERIQHSKKDLIEVMPGPDFATGASLLFNKSVMDEVYKTGKGSVTLRSKYTVDTKNKVIEVNEIPYTTTIEAIMETIVSLIKAGKITEISDIRNEIGLHGFRLAIDYKRGVDPDVLMRKLFRLTKLQDVYSFNMTVLVDGLPRLLGVYDILDEWIKWRRKCVRRELQFDLNKKQKELHLLEGLQKVLLDIDKAIAIIRKADKDEEVVPGLMKGFKIDEEQASYVAEIKLRNLNKDYLLNRTKAIEGLKGEIETLTNQLASDKEIDKIIIKTLKEVSKKYGIPRKTEVLTEFDDVNTITKQDIPDYPVKVYITKEGYVKKVALTSLKNSPEVKFKDGDEVLAVFDSTNSKELIVFTDKHTVYKTKLSEMIDRRPSDVADYINNLCAMESNENIVYACPSDAAVNIVVGFENGKVARFPLNVYETKQNRKKLINAYSDISKTLNIFAVDDDEDLVMENSNGRKIVFTADKVSLKTTKTTQGVQVMRLTKNVKAVKFDKCTENMEKYRAANLPAAGKA